MRTKISKPPGYIPASILCSLGGFLFGIDTGIIGPVTVMPSFTSNIIGHPSPTIHGLIVSSILIPAALASCFAGRVADVLGRPLGIAIGALVFGIGAAVEASSGHVGMFVAGRVVEGVGEGLYLGTLVVYICEISPPRHRGALTTLPQLLITFGLVTGFFTCYGTTTLSSSFSWRLPFILLASYSLVFSAAVFFWLPASPRWLTLRGRVQEASDAWDKLGVLSADREKILDQLEASVLEGDPPESSSTNLNRPEPALTTAIPMVDMSVVDAPTPTTKKAQILEVFSSNARPRLLLAVFLMGMQQLSGIDGVLYYAPLLFQQAGLSTNKSTFLASGVSAILIFAVTIPATILTDRWSRRASTILGGLSMALTMFLMGGLYAANAVHAHSGAGRWIVIICIYVFAVIFSISWAVGIKLYAAEIQPQRTRATATSIAHGSNWLSNFLVALVTPTLLAKTSYGAYFMFGACTFATAGVCWVFMPETRGKSLDEIELAFQTSHASGLKEFAGKVQKKLFSKRPATVEA